MLDVTTRRGDAVERSVIAPGRSRVAVIEAEADIRRSPEVVFDYASDPANEPQWNIRMKRLEKLTDGRVGVCARYRMEFTQGPPAISEVVRFERPSLWELERSGARTCFLTVVGSPHDGREGVTVVRAGAR